MHRSNLQSAIEDRKFRVSTAFGLQIARPQTMMTGYPNGAQLWMSRLLAGLREALVGLRELTDSVESHRRSSFQNSRRPEPAPPKVFVDNAVRRTKAGLGIALGGGKTVLASPARPAPSLAGADAEAASPEATPPACCSAAPTEEAPAESEWPAGLHRLATSFEREGMVLQDRLASA